MPTLAHVPVLKYGKPCHVPILKYGKPCHSTGYQPDKHMCASLVTVYFFRNNK